MEGIYVKKRVEYIDKLRGIAMLLVLIGHNDTVITSYIYSFHMPLFFFISGLVYKDKGCKFKDFVKNKFKTIIIPYFALSLILYIIWIPLIQIQGIKISNRDIIRNFIGIFYSQGATDYMWWGIQLWFLPCLFITSLIFFLINKQNKKLTIISMIFVSAIGFSLSKFININFLWSFDIALVGVLFYGSGFLLKDRINSYEFKVKDLMYICIAFIFFIICNIFNKRIDMYSGDYNNILFFIINSFLGIYISIAISKSFHHGKIIKFIGTNTIIILAFHIRILDLIKSIHLMIFKIPLNISSVFNGIVLVPILQIILIIPIIALLKQLKQYIKLRNNKKIKENTIILGNEY